MWSCKTRESHFQMFKQHRRCWGSSGVETDSCILGQHVLITKTITPHAWIMEGKVPFIWSIFLPLFPAMSFLFRRLSSLSCLPAILRHCVNQGSNLQVVILHVYLFSPRNNERHCSPAQPCSVGQENIIGIVPLTSWYASYLLGSLNLMSAAISGA